MILQHVSPRRWPFIALASVSIFAGLFCASGYVMAGSFTVANPEASGHWRQVATRYAAGLLLSLFILFYAAVALWQRARLARNDRAF